MYDPTFAHGATVTITSEDGETATAAHKDVLHVPYLAFTEARQASGDIVAVSAQIDNGHVEETRRMSSAPFTPQEIRAWTKKQVDLNAGVTCGHCGTEIGFKQGTSSPVGSMHRGCARQHEAENPVLW